jgi:hypothetical protein
LVEIHQGGANVVPLDTDEGAAALAGSYGDYVQFGCRCRQWGAFDRATMRWAPAEANAAQRKCVGPAGTPRSPEWRRNQVAWAMAIH